MAELKIESALANEFIGEVLPTLSENDCFELARKASDRAKALVAERHELEAKNARKTVVSTLMQANGITEAEALNMLKMMGVPGFNGDQPETGVTYVNPDDVSETWVGGSRGRKPIWLQTYLDKGGKFADIVQETPEEAPETAPEEAPETAPEEAPETAESDA